MDDEKVGRRRGTKEDRGRFERRDEKKGRQISERVFPGLRLLEDLLICVQQESYIGKRDTEQYLCVKPHISGPSLCSDTPPTRSL